MSKLLKLIFIMAVVFSSLASADTRILRLSGDTDFGEVPIGSTATKTITIKNEGDSVLHISEVYLHESIMDYYSFTDWSGDIGAGESHDIDVTFTPTVSTPHNYNGSIYVASNKTAGNSDKNLYASIGSSVNCSRVLSLTGDMHFGRVARGETSTKILTVHNEGTCPLTISQIYLHESIEPNYSFDDWSGVIPAGGSHDINVTYSPTVEPTSGLIYFVTDKSYGGSDKDLYGDSSLTPTPVPVCIDPTTLVPEFD